MDTAIQLCTSVCVCLCVVQNAATSCYQDKGDGQGEDSSTGGEVCGIPTAAVLYRCWHLLN